MAALQVSLHAARARVAATRTQLASARGTMADARALLAATQLRLGARGTLPGAHPVSEPLAAPSLTSRLNSPLVLLPADRPCRPIPDREAMLPGLAEPLTTRELDVLLLLARRLSSKEVGAALAVSWQSVATYTNGLYRKLGVVGRQAMIQRAATLGVLPAGSWGVVSTARAPQPLISFDCGSRRNGSSQPQGE